MGLTYAIADLHGRFDLLQAALTAITEDAGERPHKVVTLGDYIDRGPQSREIIDHLMLAQQAGRPLICLKGNHEDIMVQTLRRPLHPDWWIGNGGARTLLSYGHPRHGEYHPEVVPEEHLAWLEALPLMHVDEHRVFVHAWVDSSVPLDRQEPQRMMWVLYPDGAQYGHKLTRRHVVHGHHQFEDGPKLYRGRTDLDTFAWFTGRLVVGVFDDDTPGAAVSYLEVCREPHHG